MPLRLVHELVAGRLDLSAVGTCDELEAGASVCTSNGSAPRSRAQAPETSAVIAYGLWTRVAADRKRKPQTATPTSTNMNMGATVLQLQRRQWA